LVAALGGSEIARGQQQSQLGLLAPREDWTKQGLRCNHAIWSLVDHWADFP